MKNDNGRGGDRRGSGNAGNGRDFDRRGTQGNRDFEKRTTRDGGGYPRKSDRDAKGSGGYGQRSEAGGGSYPRKNDRDNQSSGGYGQRSENSGGNYARKGGQDTKSSGGYGQRSEASGRDSGRYGQRSENGGRDFERREGGSYGGNRMQGAARRTYTPNNAGPRVGSIADDVPKAVRISGDKPLYPPKRDEVVNRDYKPSPRRDHGPRPYYKASPKHEYEAPEIPEDLALEFDDVPFEDENLLVGRNPIREALRSERPMEKLLVASGDLSGTARDIIKMAKEANVIVQYVDRTRLDQIYPAHQGMLAYVAAVPYVAIEVMLENAKEKGEDPFLVILDGITDPHNLGAIIRSAECAGAHGVILPERRAAGLGPAAAKAAAGALSHMPIARVKNINRTIEELKEKNIWVIGTSMEGEDTFTADLSGPVALVIGSEGDGVSKLTLEKCDRKVTLPMKGHIESLNASVAAGVLMYAIVRARGV